MPRHRQSPEPTRLPSKRNSYILSLMEMRRLISVEMELRDMLYVSYLLPAGRVRPFVPSQLSLALIGKECVFVSLVAFRGTTKAVSILPSPPFPFAQLNIRTYVIDPITNKPAVYFINCGISSPFITFLYRIISGMPVEATPFTINTIVDHAGRYTNYSLTGNWHGELSVEAREDPEPLSGLPPFPHLGDAFAYLIEPRVGYYGAPEFLQRLSIFHPPLIPRKCVPGEIRFPYLESIGLMNKGEIMFPHSTLLVPLTPFLIYLPPRREAPSVAGRNS